MRYKQYVIGLKIPHDAPPDVLGEAGEGRPEDLAGVVLEVGEDALVLAAEACEFRLALVGDVARVEDAEIAHLDDIVDELLAHFAVGRAEEVFVLEPEFVLHADHDGGGEAAHAQTLQRLVYGPALSRRQCPEHVVVIHHLPQTDASYDVVAEHVRHAEDGVETGVRIDQRLAFLERGVLLQPALETRVQEGIVELSGMEMHLDGYVIKDVYLAFLVDDVVYLVFRGECPDRVAARSFDPEIYIAAHAALGIGVEMREAGALQDAALQAALLQDALELCDASLVVPVHLGDPYGQVVPFIQDVIGRELMFRQTVDAVVQDSEQGLDLGHVGHLGPLHVGQILLEGGCAAHGDQQEFPERMHYRLSSQPNGCLDSGSLARG